MVKDETYAMKSDMDMDTPTCDTCIQEKFTKVSATEKLNRSSPEISVRTYVHGPRDHSSMEKRIYPRLSLYPLAASYKSNSPAVDTKVLLIFKILYHELTKITQPTSEQSTAVMLVIYDIMKENEEER